jgi:hypothetical protein
MLAGRLFAMARLFIGALLFGSLVLIALPARAQVAEVLDVDVSSPVNQNRSQARDDSWYYQPSNEPTAYKPNPKMIAQQRAMAYGQQRSNRLAALNWYGMSNSRPIASPTPFTSMYSPAWQSPGGQPFAWYPGRPTYIFR